MRGHRAPRTLALRVPRQLTGPPGKHDKLCKRSRRVIRLHVWHTEFNSERSLFLLKNQDPFRRVTSVRLRRLSRSYASERRQVCVSETAKRSRRAQRQAAKSATCSGLPVVFKANSCQTYSYLLFFFYPTPTQFKEKTKKNSK